MSNDKQPIDLSNPNVFAVPVVESMRMDFLPKLFPAPCPAIIPIEFEHAVYDIMRRMTGGIYTGGYWDFGVLSNGGGFMWPRTMTCAMVTMTSLNGAVRTVSPYAAGIVCCATAFSHLSFKWNDEGGARMVASQHAADLYHQLRAYYLQDERPSALSAEDVDAIIELLD